MKRFKIKKNNNLYQCGAASVCQGNKITKNIVFPVRNIHFRLKILFSTRTLKHLFCIFKIVFIVVFYMLSSHMPIDQCNVFVDCWILHIGIMGEPKEPN